MTSGSPPPGAVTIDLGGHALHLLPERAAWHPATRTLFIADLHLGKAAAFRAQGQPVPAGTTQDNLQRLGALAGSTGATRLVFLGDFLHAAAARRAGVMAPLALWREARPSLACVLVRGNHDAHAGDPPAHLGFASVDEPWPVAGAPGLLACHHPQRVAQHGVLAGHWHPALTLRGPARDRQRLPAFCRLDGLLVLPAFGAFTGSSWHAPPVGSTCHAVGGGRVWPGIAIG